MYFNVAEISIYTASRIAIVSHVEHDEHRHWLQRLKLTIYKDVS